jgi:hypothetical protein
MFLLGQWALKTRVADSDLGLEPDPRIQILKIDHQNKDLPSKQK